jgi:hypothetical protein
MSSGALMFVPNRWLGLKLATQISQLALPALKNGTGLAISTVIVVDE